MYELIMVGTFVRSIRTHTITIIVFITNSSNRMLYARTTTTRSTPVECQCAFGEEEKINSAQHTRSICNTLIYSHRSISIALPIVHFV